jgi:hypothetical protein
MNVEVGAEAALFPEKEYINGIFVAVPPRFAFNNSLGLGSVTAVLSVSCWRLHPIECKI